MSTVNRSQPSTSMTPSNRVRQLWPTFEQSVSRSRATMNHKVNAVIEKADADHNKSPANQRIPLAQHNSLKSTLVRQIQEPYYDNFRRQWEARLTEVGLRMDDWTDMTADEMKAVSEVLGGAEDSVDEPIVVVPPVAAPAPPPPPAAPTYSTAFLQPLAPALSASTRSTNVSTTSSYAFVNPSEFHSEDEDHFFMPVVATSHDLTSDDDDGSGWPIPRRRKVYDAWSSDSSLQNSLDSSSGIPASRPLASSFVHNASQTKSSSAKQQAAQHEDKASKTKAKQAYQGPSLDDPDEPLGEEEDFERFKMQIRIQKIVEFHQAAALADVDLAVAVYKSRKANGDKHEISSKISDHHKRMSQLQMEKEEERKNIVKTERSKRRSELRRRPGRSNTLIAPVPSVPSNPTWLTDFQENVASEMGSNFDLQKILGDDSTGGPDHVERFMQQLFPETAPPPSFSSTSHDSPPQIYQPQPSAHNTYLQPGSTWAAASTSSQMQSGYTSASQATQSHFQKQPSSDSQASKHRMNGKARPSLFGDDDCSDDEESPPPQTAVPNASLAQQQPANLFLNTETSSFLVSQPDIAAAIAQWNVMGGGEASAPASPWDSQAPPVPSWDTRPSPQTPVANPWATKDARATPVASGWTRRNPPVSTPQPTAPSHHLSFNNTFNAPLPPDVSMSLGTMAILNAANAKAKMSVASTSDIQPFPQTEIPMKKPSPPMPVAPVAAAASTVPSPPTMAPPAKTEKSTPAPVQPPAGKKLNKKQRQAMKKGAAAVVADEPEPEAEPEPVPVPPPAPTSIWSAFGSKAAAPQVAVPLHPTPPHSTASAPPVAEAAAPAMPKVIPGMSRLRKDSSAPATPFGAWDEAVSTPRPGSKIPAHLQEAAMAQSAASPRPNLFKKFQTVDGLGGGSQTSTIKAPSWGTAATGAASRSAWSIFGSDATPATVKAPEESSVVDNTSGVRDPWLPGGFEVEEKQRVEEAPQQFWTPAKEPVMNKPSPPAQQPLSAAQHRLRRMTETSSAAPSPAAARAASASKPGSVAPPAQAPVAPSPVGSKKGKGKKNGKGKKVTMEEVQDEDQDNRGEKLPVDSKFIMEQQIVEPKPSVAPTMFDSIITYGNDDDDDDEATTSSSLAPTPSTAPSSPPDLFDGDEARIAAAIKELQQGSLKMGKLYDTWTPGNAAAKQTSPWTQNTSEAQPAAASLFTPFIRSSAKPASAATPVWGQPTAKDKGKAKMKDDEPPKVVPNPTIQNMKRNKAGGGGKFF